MASADNMSVLKLRTLDKIARDYVRSEVTALWLHDRSTQTHTLIFAVAEMCPAEQEVSPPLQSEDGRFAQIRKPASPGRTGYVTRALSNRATDALAFYRGGANGRTLPNDPEVTCVDIGGLQEEPPSEVPMLLPSNLLDRTSFSSVFPKRRTALRLCSRLDLSQKAASFLSDKEFSALNQLAVDTLGFSFTDYPEHLGSVHLLFANPLVRFFEERLSADSSHLLIDFHVRQGRSVLGSTLELTDERPLGPGFNLRHRVTGRSQAIRLPNPPEQLRRVWMADGSLSRRHPHDARVMA
jgi:hypothetical protein